MTTDTRSVRPGEELDAARLQTYLESRSVGDGDVAIEQFPAGSSNLTYLVRLGPEEYVLRRPPFGNAVKSAHDMRREFDVLAKLSAVYRPAPKPILFCDDASVIGSEFYLMERRRGLILRGTTGQHQLREREGSSNSVNTNRVSPPTAETLDHSQEFRLEVAKSFIQNLADLHALDYEAAGLESLGRPDGYARRQVEGWTKRYFAAKTHEHADLESVIAWLNAHIPAETGASLVHNDYKFDNVMLDPDDLTRITAVLDWEMVTVGDPLMDLGTTLGYWMDKDAGDRMLDMPFNPRVLMENISRRELAEMYSELSGRDVANILYYYVFGTFKIAVIAQQIYARFAKGFTADPRFARFDAFVAALGAIAARAVERGTL